MSTESTIEELEKYMQKGHEDIKISRTKSGACVAKYVDNDARYAEASGKTAADALKNLAAELKYLAANDWVDRNLRAEVVRKIEQYEFEKMKGINSSEPFDEGYATSKELSLGYFRAFEKFQIGGKS